MKKSVIFLFLSLVIGANFTFAYTHHYRHNQPPSFKEQRAIDNHYKERLNLSDEQVDVLKKNRVEHKKEMGKILKRMHVLREEIKNVYLLGLPKFQADLRTATPKAELALLKQRANALKKQYNKAILDVLNEEQRVEFNKIKNERFEKFNDVRKNSK